MNNTRQPLYQVLCELPPDEAWRTAEFAYLATFESVYAAMDDRLPDEERRERTRLALEGLKRLEEALVPFGFQGPFDGSDDTPTAV